MTASRPDWKGVEQFVEQSAVNVIGFSGLHQSAPFKKAMYPDLSQREYRVAQGFDAAAALVTNAGVVAAAAEERFSRDKATGHFPAEAIRYSLRQGGLAADRIEHVAHGFSYEPFKESFVATEDGARHYAEVFSPDVQRRNLDHFFPETAWAGKLVPVSHHLAHAASAFYPSGFSESLILISDGMGEIHSMTVAVGQGSEITVLRQIPALHSLGILYGVFTLYLGFAFGVDEYKIMGLAPYGNPRRYYDQLAALVHLRDDGTYTIPVLAENRTPLEKETHRGVLRAIAERFGPAREPGAPLTQHHQDIAAALQSVLQACQLHVLRHFRKETGMEHLCLAGGVALNCSVNGAINRSRLFKRTFIQPAAGDDGAAVGAALYVHRRHVANQSPRRMAMPLWGPEFSDSEVDAALAGREGCSVLRPGGFDAICREVAGRLNQRQVVGWFQGRMEYGPRALGARSILADPRDPGMRDKINALVKKREAFRPFAPIVTEDAATKFFDIRHGDEDTYAHMLFVAQVRAQFREQLPAVTHVDGSARVQTVSRASSPRLWQLLRAFEATTGLPILLNTSFNVKGQPIVCTPAEAIDTFLFAGLDLLVLGDAMVSPVAGETEDAARRAAARIPIGVG